MTLTISGLRGVKKTILYVLAECKKHVLSQNYVLFGVFSSVYDQNLIIIYAKKLILFVKKLTFMVKSRLFKLAVHGKNDNVYHISRHFTKSTFSRP